MEVLIPVEVVLSVVVGKEVLMLMVVAVVVSITADMDMETLVLVLLENPFKMYQFIPVETMAVVEAVLADHQDFLRVALFLLVQLAVRPEVMMVVSDTHLVIIILVYLEVVVLAQIAILLAVMEVAVASVGVVGLVMVLAVALVMVVVVRSVMVEVMLMQEPLHKHQRQLQVIRHRVVDGKNLFLYYNILVNGNFISIEYFYE